MSLCSKFPPIHIGELGLPRYYGSVIMVGVGSFAVNMFLASRVMKARKDHNVEYPDVYSADNKAFNCIQRGHQNYLEGLPHFLFFLGVGGLHAPRVCAAGGAVYLISRIFYYRGYATGDPKSRKQGAFGYLGYIPMILATISLGVRHMRMSCR